jgi:hypothetical protein
MERKTQKNPERWKLGVTLLYNMERKIHTCICKDYDNIEKYIKVPFVFITV